MMNYKENYAFWKESIRSKIKNIYFISDNAFNQPYSQSWDVSMAPNAGDVIAYLSNTTLYIVAKKGNVLSPLSNAKSFENFASLVTFSFKNYDTTFCNYTNALFANCVSLETIDLNDYNTSNLTAITSIFLNCESLKVIDFRKQDFHKITQVENAFYNCYSLEKLYLPEMSLNDINNSERVFKNAGANAPYTSIYYNGELYSKY